MDAWVYARWALGMLLLAGCRAAPAPEAGSTNDLPDLATPTAYDFALRLGTRPDPHWVELSGHVSAPCGASVGLHFDPPDRAGALRIGGRAVAGGARFHVAPVAACGANGQGRVAVAWSGQAGEGLRVAGRAGAWTWTADHWPDRARTYLPVADHPSRPARWRWRIEAPPGHTVLASGARRPDGAWSTRAAFPAKAVAFVAAPLVLALDSGRVQAWAPADRAEAFGRTTRSAPHALRWLEARLGPSPVDTVRLVLANTRFLGMENAGLIVLSQAPMGRAAEHLIAHELAHQWLGTGASEASWSDLWIAEGGSTWLAMRYGASRWGARWAERERSGWTCPSGWRPDASGHPSRLLTHSYGCGALVLERMSVLAGPTHVTRALARTARGRTLSRARLRVAVGEDAWTAAVRGAKTDR